MEVKLTHNFGNNKKVITGGFDFTDRVSSSVVNS